MKPQCSTLCKWAFGGSEAASEADTKWKQKVYIVFTFCSAFLFVYFIAFAEEYARQMREGKVKFLLVDAETYPRLKAAIKMLDWSVTLLSFGDLNNADIVQVTNLLKDDGSGKF